MLSAPAGAGTVTPTQKKAFRAALVAWCAAARGNEPRVHYSQQRPFRFYGLHAIGHDFCTLDCSGFVGCAFHYASIQSAFAHDPLDEYYSGYGNTSTSESYLRTTGKRVTTQGYLVGDIARWGQGNHAHMALCTKAGTAKTADWTSHGSDAGPLIVRLHYRSDLVGVWRHQALL